MDFKDIDIKDKAKSKFKNKDENFKMVEDKMGDPKDVKYDKDKYDKDKYDKDKYDKDKYKTEKDKAKENKDKEEKYKLEKDGKDNKFKEKNKAKMDKEKKKEKEKGGKDKVIKETKRRPKKKAVRTTWATYIHKVLKTVHEDDCTLSSKAMQILDSFANDLFERISTEAVKLLRLNDKRTLTSMEIQTAARLVLPGELCKHAIQDGAKAVSKYQMADSHA